MRDIDGKEFLYKASREMLGLTERGATHQEDADPRMDLAACFSRERVPAENYGLLRQAPEIDHAR